jgi:hypothetical protein
MMSEEPSRCADDLTRHPEETVSVLTYRMGVQDANVAGTSTADGS